MRAARIAAAVAIAAVALAAGTMIGWAAIRADPPAGEIQLSQNPHGALFDLARLAPGDAHTRCATVTNHGGTPAAIRMTGAATSNTGLAEHLRLTVEAGTRPATTAPGACAGFSADRTDLGLGAGVLFAGPLADFPADRATLSDTRSIAPAGDRAYRLTITVAPDAPPARRATHDFRFAGVPAPATAASAASAGSRCERLTFATAGPAITLRKKLRIPRRDPSRRHPIAGYATVRLTQRAGRPQLALTITLRANGRTLRRLPNLAAAELRLRGRLLARRAGRPYRFTVPASAVRTGEHRLTAIVRRGNRGRGRGRRSYRRPVRTEMTVRIDRRQEQTCRVR